MKTRIAIELQPCCGKRSGIGTYTYELARRLENDDKFDFYGQIFNFMGLNDLSGALDGIEFPVFINKSMPYGVYRRIWGKIPLNYNQMFTATDISHFFNYIVPPRIKGKVITTIHDMSFLRFPETLDEKNRMRIIKDISYSVERSNLVLTVSEFSKKEIMELLKLPKEKLAVVYNASPTPEKSVCFDVIAKKFGIRQPYILFLGNLEPRKNIVRLIKAYKRLKKECKNVQLVLAGSYGWKAEDIMFEVQRAEDVVLTGYIGGAEKSAIFENASIFAFTSLYEGFGIPILEAMQHGVPIVCSNTASIPEVAGDAARYVDPLDEEDIARGLYNVLTNRDLAESLIAKGRRQTQKFSWDISAAKLKEIYKSLA